jgi:hypothetical protein
MIKINYLMPILVNYKNQEIVCFIDFTKDNVYYLNDLKEEDKKELTNLILLKVNNDNLVDIKNFDINSNLKINKIINDIKNETIIKDINKHFEDNKDE